MSARDSGLFPLAAIDLRLAALTGLMGVDGHGRLVRQASIAQQSVA